MSFKSGETNGVSVLSFDNGGAGSYSQLRLVKEYMGRIAVDKEVNEDDVYPADYFDLMGGVGFGGLLAIMFGHLRMNAEEATNALIAIADAVFPEGNSGDLNREMNTRRLKEAIEEMLQTRGFPLDTKMEDERRPAVICKVVVYAAGSADLSHARAFRTYKSRGSNLNPTIVDAICATMSTPSFFLPTKIGTRPRQQSFVGAALGASNPTRELLKEAGIVFGNDARIAQIISLGSGLPRLLSLDSSGGAPEVDALLRNIVADCEVVARELSTRLFHVSAYLRLNVDRGMEGIQMTDWSDLGAIESHTSGYVESIAVTEAIDASLRRIRERVGTITLGQLNNSSQIKITAKKAPAVSPYHVIRKESDLLKHQLVTSVFTQQRILPITGMGGCGKTQLVSYFLREHGSLYKQIIYLDASSTSSIKADLQAWAQSLGAGHERDVWEDGLQLLSNNPISGPSALIFDNADDPHLDLLPYFPQSNSVTIIITSRNRNVGTLSTTHHLELGEMDDEEALTTMLQAARRRLPLAPEETMSAHTLMRELGNLAVALVQVGTYCHELSSTVSGVLQPYTFTQYLSLFTSHRAELLKQAGPSSLDNYQRGVYTTFDLSYKAIPHISREVFHVLSFFHHTSIPVSALSAAAEKNFLDGSSYSPRPDSHRQVIHDLTRILHVDGKWSDLHMQEIIRSLRSFSLITATSVDDSVFLQLHPLIQSWSRDIDPPSSQHYKAMAIQVITACAHDENIGRLYRYLLPHIADLLSQGDKHALHINDLMAAGYVLQDQGQHRLATGLFEVALETAKNSTNMEREKINWVKTWVSRGYGEQGRGDDAKVLQMEVLEDCRRTMGTEHLGTTNAVVELAARYWEQGGWSEAEALEREALEQYTRALGREHRYTIMAAGNLAGTYRAQGRWSEAEKLEVEVLEQSRSILGKDHPDTIMSARHLAATYRKQSRWSEAETLQLEVIEQKRRILGKDHLDTITALSSLATTYWYQGQWSKAEALELEVVQQRKRILGTDDSLTISAVLNLAMTYRDQGRWNEAEALQLEALEQRRKIHGKEHSGTISVVTNLAHTYRKQGRWKEAEMLQLEVLEQRRRIEGREHPYAISAAAQLAHTYRAQGRWSEAEKLEVEVLEQQKKTLGAKHPYTITAAANLGDTYRGQGRLSESEAMQSEALEQRKGILGTDHPSTLEAAQQLSLTYHCQGRLGEAGELGGDVLRRRKGVLGEEHPATIQSAASLADIYVSQNRLEDALNLLAPAVQLSLKVAGKEHPHTQSRIRDLVSLYEKLGRSEEAQETRILLV